MKFKKGDEVIVHSGWYTRESSNELAIGIIDDCSDFQIQITLHEPTKCKWKYRVMFVACEDAEHYAIYNSPLWQALK